MGPQVLLTIIVGCELGFWFVLFLGLFARYVLNMPRLGKVFLYTVPVIDLTLLCVTVLDLYGGAVAESAHGLAAIYLGFTLVYGHSLIQWADDLAAYKFIGSERTKKRELFGLEYARYEWQQWFKGCMACFVAACLLYGAILYVGDVQKTKALVDWFYILLFILGAWAVFGPIWYSVYCKEPPNSRE
ncbi:MAG: hypothetical protein ACI93R_001294 [Flavobacteriales bacterium]|jgi:hypothetical protein